MEETSTGMAVRVGAFAALALAMAAALIIRFGKIEQRARETYRIYAVFKDAGNLIPGANVSALSVPVGRVATIGLDERRTDRVRVTIDLFTDTQLRRGSQFAIRQLGLLGDQYIAVYPNADVKESFLAPGEVVEGTSPPSFEEAISQGTNLLASLHEITNHLQAMLVRVNERVLSDENLDQLSATLSNLTEAVAQTAVLARSGSSFLDQTQARLGQSLEGADATLAEGRVLLAEMRGAVTNVQGQVELRGGQLGALLEETTAVANSLAAILGRIERGEGTVGRLVADDSLARDVEGLVENWRLHGILYQEENSRGPDQPAGRPRPMFGFSRR